MLRMDRQNMLQDKHILDCDWLLHMLPLNHMFQCKGLRISDSYMLDSVDILNYLHIQVYKQVVYPSM